MQCGFCNEEIEEPLPDHRPGNLHRECLIRLVVGSVAHQERRCHCYIPGSTASDPPHLTLRQAAKLAWVKFEMRQARN